MQFGTTVSRSVCRRIVPAILLFLIPAVEATAQGTDPEWLEFTEALEKAAEEHKPLFVYVRAPWCGPCYRVETDVLPELGNRLRGFVTAKVDLSERPEPGSFADQRAFLWARAEGLQTPPAFAVISPDGVTVAALRGFTQADPLERTLSLAERRIASSTP